MNAVSFGLVQCGGAEGVGRAFAWTETSFSGATHSISTVVNACAIGSSSRSVTSAWATCHRCALRPGRNATHTQRDALKRAPVLSSTGSPALYRKNPGFSPGSYLVASAAALRLG